MICDFGCSGNATHQLKNGKWCCCKSVNSCPGMREKNSKANSTVEVDLVKAQELYDSGLTWPQVAKALSITTASMHNHTKYLKSRTRSEAGKLSTYEHSQETKDKLSKIAKSAGFGGLTNGGGKGIKGWYKGFFCDSSWELAYVIYCLDHDLNLTRNTEKFKYEFEGLEKNYVPDFICEGSYVEIKGFNSDEWKAKLGAFPHKITVIYKDEIKFYLDYAKNKYGSNFTDLYD